MSFSGSLNLTCSSFPIFSISLILSFLPISSTSTFFMLSLRFLYFGAIDSKLREEFLIYLDDATCFFPHRKTREFEIAINGKTPIESSQMDTTENEGAFYKQANVRNNPVKCGREEEKLRFPGARIAARNGYFVLEQATKKAVGCDT